MILDVVCNTYIHPYIYICSCKLFWWFGAARNGFWWLKNCKSYMPLRIQELKKQGSFCKVLLWLLSLHCFFHVLTLNPKPFSSSLILLFLSQASSSHMRMTSSSWSVSTRQWRWKNSRLLQHLTIVPLKLPLPVLLKKLEKQPVHYEPWMVAKMVSFHCRDYTHRRICSHWEFMQSSLLYCRWHGWDAFIHYAWWKVGARSLLAPLLCFAVNDVQYENYGIWTIWVVQLLQNFCLETCRTCKRRVKLDHNFCT